MAIADTASKTPRSSTDDQSAPESAPAPPQVLYIMGASRSGSTILGVVLDQVASTFYAGELCDWPELEGKSTVPHSAPFWDTVRDRFGPVPANAHRYKRVFEHPAGLVNPAAFSRTLRHEYEVVTKAVLEAVKDESDCDTVIDSSHYPRRARTLRRILGKDGVRLVFIVRRPSSVARSFRTSGDKGWFRANAYLAVVGVLSWLVYLTHSKKNRVRISYEALANSPVGTGARALGHPIEGLDPANMNPPRVLIGNRFVKASEAISIRPLTEEPDLTLLERLTDIFQWPYRVAGSYAAHLELGDRSAS
ncbi:MAG: sulfotransferase [Acidimicrobiia bacterium]|nr:sulfotransferase [Acidimicrobiia bacterium]